MQTIKKWIVFISISLCKWTSLHFIYCVIYYWFWNL